MMLADFDITPWFGVFVPAGTPQPIVEGLNKEMVRIIALPDVRRQMHDSGYVPRTNTPEEFAAMIRAERPYWQKIIKDAGLPPIE
jgi:tripartite-type tricarboxylate transporter receptor subunit TctC